jgi:hypothetical protein
MAARRKSGRLLPFGNKPRGRQRVRVASHARARVRYGPTAQESVAGTETSTTPGVFSSAAGGAGYRTLDVQRDPGARQPATFGWFAPFAVGTSLAPQGVAVPFADAVAQKPRSTVMPAPIQHGAVLAPSPYATSLPTTPVRSDVFRAL